MHTRIPVHSKGTRAVQRLWRGIENVVGGLCKHALLCGLELCPMDLSAVAAQGGLQLLCDSVGI